MSRNNPALPRFEKSTSQPKAQNIVYSLQLVSTWYRDLQTYISNSISIQQPPMSQNISKYFKYNVVLRHDALEPKINTN